MPPDPSGPIRFSGEIGSTAIRLIAETGSTNADLAARIARGEIVAEGEWLLAERQTAGRGRLGRDWLDGAGNFMGSTVVQIAAGDPPPQTLALMAGIALHDAVSGFVSNDRSLMLKWPNDLMLDSAKLAGILLERVENTIVVGIGVNLVSAPDLTDRPCIALGEVGTAPNRDAFATILVRSFAEELARWRTAGLAPLLRRWHGAAHPLGTELIVQPPGEAFTMGRFAGLNDDGNLRLQTADGQIKTVHAGDVMLADEH